MVSFHFLICVIPFAVSVCFCYEYCSFEEDLCGVSSKHIACVESKKPDEYEFKISSCPITKKLRDLILKKHNSIRNQTACGNLVSIENQKLFPSASKMMELNWDYELAYLAELQGKQCRLEKDSCRSTKRFRFVAQITSGTVSSDDDTVQIITNELDSWIENIQKITNPEQAINKYSRNSSYSDYIIIISDSIRLIGCSFVKCTLLDKITQILTCNYNNDLSQGHAVYKIGEPQTDCFKRKMILNKNCLCAYNDF